MVEQLERGAAGRLRWTYRFTNSLRQTQNLLQRGLRPQLVSELTGIPAKLCMEVRRELLPNAPAIRSRVPIGMEARRMRTLNVYRAGSVFVAAYLSAAGTHGAARRLDIESWCTAFDITEEVCHRLGWPALQADYAYVIAREMTNPEELVWAPCDTCGAPYYCNYRGLLRCPFCRELEKPT